LEEHDAGRDDDERRRDGRLEVHRRRDGTGTEARRADADGAGLAVVVCGGIELVRTGKRLCEQQTDSERSAEPRLPRGSAKPLDRARLLHKETLGRLRAPVDIS
jgi:hypothetical protein